MTNRSGWTAGSLVGCCSRREVVRGPQSPSTAGVFLETEGSEEPHGPGAVVHRWPQHHRPGQPGSCPSPAHSPQGQRSPAGAQPPLTTE